MLTYIYNNFPNTYFLLIKPLTYILFQKEMCFVYVENTKNKTKISFYYINVIEVIFCIHIKSFLNYKLSKLLL